MMFYQRRFMKYFGMMSKLHYAINKEEPSTSLKASGKFKKKKTDKRFSKNWRVKY